MANVVTPFPIWTSYTVTLTGWRNGDPNQFSPTVSVTIDDVTWASVQAVLDAGLTGLDAILGGAQIVVSGSLTAMTPFSGGNNDPAVQFSSTHVGFTSLTSIHDPRFLVSFFPSVIPLLSASQTMSFRLANVNDFLGGIFTPRTLTGVNATLSVIVSDGFQARKSRSFAQVVG